MGIRNRRFKKQQQKLLKPQASKNALALIQEQGLNIQDIPGSGKDGKITVRDVRLFLDSQVKQTLVPNEEEE